MAAELDVRTSVEVMRMLLLEGYAAAGFERAVHWLPSAPRGPVERALDRYEAAIAEFNGE